MAAADVLGCLGAIVSAFHGATGLIQIIKQRNDRRRRMNGVTQNEEEAFEEKMLIKSLSSGESQIKSARDEKYKRYGAAFKEGDAEALSALKDVMVNLQMEIISALQVAQAVANAQLDVSRLNETAIMNKGAALRAMDELCKRLPAVEIGDEEDVRSVKSRESNTGEVRMTGVDRPLAVTVPSSPPSRPAIPASSRPTRTVSQPLPQEKAGAAKEREKSPSAKKRGALARMFSNLGASLSVANDDYGSFQRVLQAERTETLQEAERQRKSPDPNEMARKSPNIDEMSRPRDSGFGGSETSSRHRHTPSITSTLFSEDRHSYVDIKAAEGTPRSDSETIPSISASPEPQSNTVGFLQLNSSSSALSLRTNATIPATRWEDDDGIMRANFAPEVVTPGFESMLPHRPSSRPDLPPPPTTHSIHPAFRDAWPVDPRVSPPVQSSEWSPHRPAKLDAYYNFCKGARQMRERLEEGLSIVMIPYSTNQPVPYWKCKQCEFRSKATNTTSLPDPIYVLSSGIRYRWLFLAKSHLRAETSQPKIEAYTYGCVFCAAEGRDTSTYPNLDALMAHIAGKHRTGVMTPAVREKTKCLVGGLPEDVEDWEIDLPESSRKGKFWMR